MDIEKALGRSNQLFIDANTSHKYSAALLSSYFNDELCSSEAWDNLPWAWKFATRQKERALFRHCLVFTAKKKKKVCCPPRLPLFFSIAVTLSEGKMGKGHKEAGRKEKKKPFAQRSRRGLFHFAMATSEKTTFCMDEQATNASKRNVIAEISC